MLKLKTYPFVVSIISVIFNHWPIDNLILLFKLNEKTVSMTWFKKEKKKEKKNWNDMI